MCRGIPAIRAYLARRGAGVREGGPDWTVTTSDGQVTRLSFDEAGRLSCMEATLPARPPAPADPSPSPRRRF